MNQDLLSHDELVELILLAFDGRITEEQFRILDNQIIRHPEARDCYYKLLTVYTGLSDYSNSGILLKGSNTPQQDVLFQLAKYGSENENTSFDMDLWLQLAKDELTAPAIEVPSKTEQPDIINKIERPVIKFSIKRSSIVSFILSAAAVIMIVLFARYAPPGSSHEAATLVSSVNAEWVNTSLALEKGSRLGTGDLNWHLKSGVAELLFDNNTRVTIEGPAEFHIAVDDQIALNYGRLYASVPPEAIGFIVTTPTSKIIDLGTEFGVEAGFGGTTELHVVKGQTTLIAEGKNRKTSLSVTEGVAKKVSGADNRISDIACDQAKFARTILNGNRIWRGENIQLASIIAGKDGFEEIDPVVGLDPVTGQYSLSIRRDVHKSTTGYNPVPDSLFIDGVFVADESQETAMIITSSGLTFACPDTAGLVSHVITVYTGDIKKQQDTIPLAIFGGQTYDNNAIVMIHSNAGITFDLDAIRQSTPGFTLESFKALGGLSEALHSVQTQLPDVGFWVLVDGQTRYEKILTLKDGEVSFDIELQSQDRFLTLIVTDGSNSTDASREYAAWNNDFFYLIDPELCLSEVLD